MSWESVDGFRNSARDSDRPGAGGLVQDIFFQSGLLTLVGLSAKNAILIVEFSIAIYRQGVPRGGNRAPDCAAVLSPDRDDIAGVHPRRGAARHRHRRGRERAALDRHGRHRRHARGDIPRGLFRAGVLRDVATIVRSANDSALFHEMTR